MSQSGRDPGPHLSPPSLRETDKNQVITEMSKCTHPEELGATGSRVSAVAAPVLGTAHVSEPE